VVQHWADTLDYGLVLPILALDGGRVVGDATLHRQRMGWKQRVGVVRIQIAPTSGTSGSGRDDPRTASHREKSALHYLMAEVIEEQAAAVRALERMGFVRGRRTGTSSTTRGGAAQPARPAVPDVPTSADLDAETVAYPSLSAAPNHPSGKMVTPMKTILHTANEAGPVAPPAICSTRRSSTNVSLIAFFAWVGLGADGITSSCYGPEEAYLALGSTRCSPSSSR